MVIAIPAVVTILTGVFVQERIDKMLKLISSFGVWVLALGMMMAPAYGDTFVGVPVVGFGSTDILGCTLDATDTTPAQSCYDSGANTTNFYIPLAGDLSFSIDSGGLVSDTATGSTTGSLDMVLYFDGYDASSGGWLTLSYGDLDLGGANNPNVPDVISLLESVQFFDSAGTLIGGTLVTDVAGATSADCAPGAAICAYGDIDSQTIMFDLDQHV